jgi:Shikimate kinase
MPGFGNIFLVGLMGSGKTTIGRQLAKSLNKEFRDSDREIEERSGASIALIFKIEGEAGFRRREQKVIDELTQLKNVVLATGGGAVLDENNRAHLKQRGFVVYLQASVPILFGRTYKDRNRPLLQTEERRRKLEDLAKQRDPLYRQVADLIVYTDLYTVRQTVRQIRVAWQRQ